LATRNPARMIRADNKGTIEAGNDADLVFLTAQGEVVNTMVGGRLLNP